MANRSGSAVRMFVKATEERPEKGAGEGRLYYLMSGLYNTRSHLEWSDGCGCGCAYGVA
jgi:hypothetical protein